MPYKSRKFDFRWIFAGIIIIIALVFAIVANINHIDSTSSKIANTIDADNGDLTINWSRYQTYNIDLSESINITQSGTYHLTGSLADGLINIGVKDGEVRLILDNVSITNSDGPAIYCSAAEDLVVELIGESGLSDGASYNTEYDEDVKGAIYSKADLTFQGDGVLNIAGNYEDAIVGKDDVKFNGGTYYITSQDDAVRGKDSIYVVNGNFIINTIANALKTTNATDTNKGFILIENGNLDITTTSGKGLNSASSTLIYGGNLTFNTYDDAIHSNSYVGIAGGVINISSGDDGIHADKELIIDNGAITISKSYEGLEAQVVSINGGDISISANDDGINAGGGADSSAMNRPGAGAFDADESCILSINGGNIYINAAGDGVDSNGKVYFNGGTTIIDGPTNNGNGALDSGSGIIMQGGEVIAVGAAGMVDPPSSDSSALSISVYFTTVQSSGTTVTIKDQNDNIILEHTSAKTFNHLSASTSTFSLGEAYTIYLNGEKYQDFTINSVTTTIGNNGNFKNRP